MTNQMDNRLRELVTKLADSAPPAPPFPQPVTKPVGVGRRAPAWALAVAGAAAVLLIIGVPFLLFSGGTAPDDAATVPTTQQLPAPTTAPGPTTTTPAVPVPVVPCTPAGLLVRSLPPDGSAGHATTPLRLINVSGSPCLLEDPLAVTGIGTGGEEVTAELGTYNPISLDSGPLVDAGDSRDMLVEVGTGCEGGALVGPEAASLRIALASGDVTVPFSGDLGCAFVYSGFGTWWEAGPLLEKERAILNAVLAFSQERTADRFAALPFADTVTLTLGPQLAQEQDASNLAEPASWVFGTEYDGFRARVAPFSALDLLAEERVTEVTVGTRDHCASPPMPVYEDFIGLRQVSIQPTDATSCLEWWAVDLFLTDAGEIAGVTLDVWEP